MDNFGPVTAAQKGKRIETLLDEIGALTHTDKETLEQIMTFVPERHWNATELIIDSYEAEQLAKETADIVETDGGSGGTDPNVN